jgi:hypothetical protein
VTQRIVIGLLVCATFGDWATAEGVFRCVENGRTVFSQSATNPSCQAIELRSEQPDPESASRQRLELEQWRQRRDLEVQRIRDRETAAEAERRREQLRALGPSAREARITARRQARAQRRANTPAAQARAGSSRSGPRSVDSVGASSTR